MKNSDNYIKTRNIPKLASVHSSQTSDALRLRDLSYHLVRMEDSYLVVLGADHQLVHVVLVVVEES